LALRAFEVDATKNRGEWLEGMQVILKAFTEDPFSFKGEHYDIPPRSLVPKTIQKPYPPLYAAATSEEAHRLCGQLGIGVISYSNFLGWDVLERNIGQFRQASAQTVRGGTHASNAAAVLVQGYCAKTDAQAEEEGAEGNLGWLKLALDSYPALAKRSADYAYMAEVDGVRDKFGNLKYFIEDSGSAVFGSPESCIRQIERYRALGFDEMVMRIDSVPHEHILKSIEMFGKYVIPHFRHPENIVRPAEEVLARMRDLRGPKPAPAAKVSS
jgi:alkanesulfonate monooxygenase SsuD/methylene tetrahydromethanopterin reductase-like flavin-dependent oxidoreductase (luciferase family)